MDKWRPGDNMRFRAIGIKLIIVMLLIAGLCVPGGQLSLMSTAAAQLPLQTTAEPNAQAEPAAADEEAPGRVDVQPLASDEQIAARLERILVATDWFEDPGVQVEEGVAFLTGSTDSDARKKWAGELTRNTQDVVAVVNKITITTPAMWDTAPAVESLRNLWHGFLRKLPLVAIGVVVLLLSWFAGMGVTRLLRHTLTKRDNLSRLLREVMARAAGVGVFLLGLYLVLVVIGLARLALTVLGGTGLIGLVLGIAFRDITENFLASIFLSIQRPFQTGDLVEIDGSTGYVQKMTIRTTILLNPEGNHIQIPNATVYKTIIRNFTSNPNRRENFVIGIGYDDSIILAQEVALDVLQKHPAVLAEPEPWVLVDKLGPATVDLKVYFWLDGTKHSWLKVRSSVIRLVKRAFQAKGISMPDEAREVIINKEVPLAVKMIGLSTEAMDEVAAAAAASGATAEVEEPKGVCTAADRATDEETVSTCSEGGLESEAKEMEAQAARTRSPEEGEDLLK